ncbi:hypothetical protein [Anaerosolibacter sp.]|uniref:hypothetical protein n=1 Tax=Anaerosolibacter sp. TaxID=1872527 RepID=UPI0039EDEA6B
MEKRDNVRQKQIEPDIPVVNEWTVYDKNSCTPQHILQRRIAFREALGERTEDIVKNANLLYASDNVEGEENEQKRNDQLKCENQKLVQHIEKVRSEQRHGQGGIISKILLNSHNEVTTAS